MLQNEYKSKIDKLGRAYATGRRKEAAARVWIKSGSGKFTVNGKGLSEYLKHGVLCDEVHKPFNICDIAGRFDVIATVKGGGLSGQAGALRLGVSRAIQNFNPSMRSVLKKDGLLTRDPRVVERKKYGRKKARKSFQFSKR